MVGTLNGSVMSSKLQMFRAKYGSPAQWLKHSLSRHKPPPLYYWRPRKGNAAQIQSNFGDELSVLIVSSLARTAINRSPENWGRKMLAVGSIIHLARKGDVVWGSGLNGKITGENGEIFTPKNLEGIDFLAVRGPLTQAELVKKGASCPSIFGDPALLLPQIIPAEPKIIPGKISIIPHYNDLQRFSASELKSHGIELIRPDSDVHTIVEAITSSEFVISSSLHGLILSDAYGIPNRRLQLGSGESNFKFEDYYKGTNRELPESGTDIHKSLKLGPVSPLDWNSQPLMDVFPFRLWSQSKNPSSH